MAPLWQFLTCTTKLFPDYARQRAFPHVWSLCVEEHFYRLLPVVACLLARAPHARRVAPVIAAGGHGVLVYVERIYNPTWNRLDGLWMSAVRVFRGSWWAALMTRGWLLSLVGGLGMAASLAPDFTSAAGATLAYCLYLTNKQVFYWVDGHADLDGAPVLARKLLAAFAVAGLLHLLIGRPGLARGVRLSHRRQLPVHF